MKTHETLLIDVSARQLRAFATVAQTLSYVDAADLLHYTEPAVYAQVKRLEAMTGVRLFERAGRRVRLTAEGSALLPVCRGALAEIDRLDSTLQQIIRASRIVIAAGPVTGSYLLPVLVRHFAREAPDVQVELVTAPADEILAMVGSGAVDLGVSGSLDQFRPPEHVSVTFWRDEPFSLHTTDAARRGLAPPVVVYTITQARGPVEALRGRLLELGVPAFETRFLASADAVKGACAAGMGYALLPRLATVLERQAGILHEVESLAGAVTGHVWICRAVAGERAADTERFVRFLHGTVDRLSAILRTASEGRGGAPRLSALTPGPSPNPGRGELRTGAVFSHDRQEPVVSPAVLIQPRSPSAVAKGPTGRRAGQG